MLNKMKDCPYSYPSVNSIPQETSLTCTYKSTISKQQGDFEVLALLYLIRPTSIAYYARNAFFIVLIIYRGLTLALFYFTLNFSPGT